MSFVESQAVRAVLLLMLAAMVFAGVAFAGYAIFLGVAPYVLPAWAAAIAGAVLLALPLLGAFVIRARAHHPQPKVADAGQSPEAAAVALIAGMAKDKPLLAVLFAGLLGAAGTIIQHKSRGD